MKIAVFLPNWIGDVVMATSAIRVLYKNYPSARLIGVCKPYVHGVLEGAPWFSEMVYLDSKGPLRRRVPGAAWQLLRKNIDIAVLFSNTFRCGLVSWLAGCRRRVGFNRHLRGPLLTDRLESKRNIDGSFKPSPIIDDYHRLVELLGCRSADRKMQLFTTRADEIAADEVWHRFHLDDHAEIICLNPGAAFGSAKHWPTRSFARLARELVGHRNCGVLVLCGPSERDLARQVVDMAHTPGIYSLADHPVSLGLTKALVRRGSLLVTTDSGPRHFAAAFDRPVVTLFGPTHIDWTETYHKRAIHLQKEVPCGPCQLRECPIDHACMRELGWDEAFEAVQRLLAVPAPLARLRRAS